MIREHNKKFFKDEVGLILFIIVYIAILLQILGVFTTWDENPDSNLYYHKIIFSVTCILSIISHIKASITNPGMIDHDNNTCVCTFYLQVHHLPMERAKRIMAQGYAKMLFENFNEEDEKDDEDMSESDEENYGPYSSISEETRTHICKKFDVEFKRCDKCYVVRTPRVHHCRICKSCIMKMDHHCPWINNCVGQFNQKFFILFCFYCFFGCLHSSYLSIYYTIYRNKKDWTASYLFMILIVLQLIFSVIFLIFTGWMLNDQWSIINNDTTMIDIKQKRFLEKRELGEVLQETFGSSFGFNWFIPYKPGGYLPYFLNYKMKQE